MRSRDYRRPRRRPKEGRAAILAGLALCAALTAACHSTASCLDGIPRDLRAEVVRVALDEGFVRADQIPRAHLEMAQLRGLPPGEHPPEHLRTLRRHALRYQVCIQDATN